MKRNRTTRLAYLGAFLLTANFTPCIATKSINANPSQRRQQVRQTATSHVNHQRGYGMRGDRGKERIDDILDVIVDHQSRQLGKGTGKGSGTCTHSVRLKKACRQCGQYNHSELTNIFYR